MGQRGRKIPASRAPKVNVTPLTNLSKIDDKSKF